MNIEQMTKHSLDGSAILGLALQKCRQEQGLSLSRLSIRGEIVISNLRNIERGHVQPSISVAMRLLNVMDVDVVNFFKNLAVSLGYFSLKCSSDGNILDGTHKADTQKQAEQLVASIDQEKIFSARSPFGVLFHAFRKRHNVTQKFVSEYAKYGLRNILDVEKGKQDPSTLNALAMVCAVAETANVDIDVFFQGFCHVLKRNR